MLKLLAVRNFAVIESIAIEFKKGLNLLTGETGSGKSIIVDALGLLLGDRGSLSQIRTGEKNAFVEGIFELSGDDAERVKSILDEAGIAGQDDEDIIIRREVAAGGKSRIFMNDRSVSVSTLRSLQPYLVEIHGQGDQKLLRSSRAQLELLDAYAGCQSLRKQVGLAYSSYKSSLVALETLRREDSERERTTELMQHELAEIDSISPIDGEDEELARQKLVLANAERILEVCGGAYNELYESERSVLASVAGMTRRLRELSELDSRFESILKELDEGAALLTEAADALRSYVESIDFSPDEFARVDNRLSEIERIKRKFATDLKGIFEMRAGFAEKLETIAGLSEEQARIQLQADAAREDYAAKATKLSKQRKAAAKKLEREIAKELPHVALQNARLSISLESNQRMDNGDGGLASSAMLEDRYYSANGADQVVILFSANPGEDMRPLSQVASGGELSRLMLTLLTASMKNCKVEPGSSTLIFDEIDSGIGGSVAEAVGRRLKSLAGANQVLCVTHQAQIARFADAHFLVEKRVVNGRSVTSVALLDEEYRVREVARMIAGDQEALTTIETARWMLKNAG